MDDKAMRSIERTIAKLPDGVTRFTVMTNKAIHEFQRKLDEGEIADLDAREGVWRVWNRALTREEIRALLAEARGGGVMQDNERRGGRWSGLKIS